MCGVWPGSNRKFTLPAYIRLCLPSLRITPGRLVFRIFAALAELECLIVRERTRAGLHVARASGRKGRRPLALSEQGPRKAKDMLRDPQITVEEIVAQLGIGASTLYRHLPDGRSAASGEQQS